MSRVRNATLGILLVLTAMLSACGPDTDDLEARVAEVKSRKSANIDPIPQAKQFESFAYEALDRRDPFAPAVAKRNAEGFGTGIKPDTNRNKEPLEEFPLDGLRMLGIIEAGGKIFAMVKAPDGVVHRVTIKNHMGQNYGEITAINEAEVSLMEIIPDGFGGWMQRAAVLALAQ